VQDLRLSAYSAFSPLLSLDADGPKRVVMSTRSGIRILVSDEVARELHRQSPNIAQFNPKLRHDLVHAKILVPSNENELNVVLQENKQAQVDDRSLFLVVQATASCQLGCDYCGQLHTKRRLARTHADEIARRLEARLSSRRWENVRVGWFGAEPLNALAETFSLGTQLQTVAADHGVGFEGIIVTNGLKLSIEAAHILEKLNVNSIEVTLDGSREFHDARRGTKGGQPTYERIIKNLIAVRRTFGKRFRIIVRCNVDRRNQKGVILLINDLASRGGSDFIDHLYFAPIHNWGNTAEDDSLTLEEFSSLEIECFARTTSAGWQPSLIPGRVTIPCMVFKDGAELYDANGNIFNCTEVSYVPSYNVPLPNGWIGNRYATGHLARQDTPPARPFENFFERVQANEVPCAKCSILPICGGKCAKQWESGVAPCPPEKLNMPQRLALEQVVARASQITIS
jgi:uncharacterized protein